MALFPESAARARKYLDEALEALEAGKLRGLGLVFQTDESYIAETEADSITSGFVLLGALRTAEAQAVRELDLLRGLPPEPPALADEEKETGST